MPSRKIVDILEAMPIKCRVVGNLHPPNASDGPDERYFYKAVTPEVFSAGKHQVAYVDAAEWFRAKQARKVRFGYGREAKPLSSRQRAMLLLKNEGDKWINLYYQSTRLTDPAKNGDMVSVLSTETIQQFEAVLVPPQTTDSDVLRLVETIARKHPLPAMNKMIKQLIRATQELQARLNTLDKHATNRMATLAAQILRKSRKAQLPAMGPKQPLQEPLTAPIAMTVRAHDKKPTRIVKDEVFFKAVIAYNTEKLMAAEERYVLADEWISRESRSVQAYARVSPVGRIIRELSPGTVDTADEGVIQRDHIMLVPPGTKSATLRKTLERIQKRDPPMRVYRQEMKRLNAGVKTGWLEVALASAKEKTLQMKFLHQALDKQHGLASNAKSTGRMETQLP